MLVHMVKRADKINCVIQFAHCSNEIGCYILPHKVQFKQMRQNSVVRPRDD